MITNATVLLAVRLVLAVESRNGLDAGVRDGGRAVGHYQIWPIAVREANRIVGRRLWTLADRRDPQLARAMCLVTLQHHYNRGTRDPVELACRWRNPYSVCPGWHADKLRRVLRNNMEGKDGVE